MVQHKPEVCFLLPHEVQTGGTLFAAGFPDLSHWIVSEDKQSITEENNVMQAYGHMPVCTTAHLALHDFEGGARLL